MIRLKWNRFSHFVTCWASEKLLENVWNAQKSRIDVICVSVCITAPRHTIDNFVWHSVRWYIRIDWILRRWLCITEVAMVWMLRCIESHSQYVCSLSLSVSSSNRRFRAIEHSLSGSVRTNIFFLSCLYFAQCAHMECVIVFSIISSKWFLLRTVYWNESENAARVPFINLILKNLARTIDRRQHHRCLPVIHAHRDAMMHSWIKNRR